MTRETFGTSITRLAALAFALVAALALALAIAPGTALALTIDDVIVSPSDDAGSVSASGGTPTQFTATAQNGWEFDNWTITYGEGNNPGYSSENPLTQSVYGSATHLTANFKKVSPTPPTAVIDPAGAGTVSVEPEEGDAAKYEATANEGWKFSFWTVEWAGGPSIEMTDNPTPGLAISQLKSITANFEKAAPTTTYKVNVTDDGNGTAEASVAEAAAGAKVQLTATPKDRSYVFDKWVSDDVTVEGDAFEMPAKNVTVKATFKKAEPVTTYAITFDANGGTGTMDKQTVEAGATDTLTANAFTRDGYTFAGWNTAKDGTGTAYADKAEVKVEGDMTLYAQWKANSSKSTGKVAKTGDTTLPMTAVVGMAAALAAGVLLVARRRMG